MNLFPEESYDTNIPPKQLFERGDKAQTLTYGYHILLFPIA